MNNRPEAISIPSSIAAVERDTGLSKDTLRVWERRYGFPSPSRDIFGERSYPVDQLHKLRALRRLIDQGHRPGKIVGLSIEHLQSLAGLDDPPRSSGDCQGNEGQLALRLYFDLIKTHDVAGLRRTLSEATHRLGLELFVSQVAAPLGQMVGDAWARGALEVFEEHLYTEAMKGVLRNTIMNLAKSAGAPKVLLTTIPNEAHGLGILVAEAFMAYQGCDCRSLGTQTPVPDIIRAATAQNVDIVALSFSSCSNANMVIDALLDLRQALPKITEIWAGGNAPVLLRRPPKDIVVIAGLSEIGPQLLHWHEHHPGISRHPEPQAL